MELLLIEILVSIVNVDYHGRVLTSRRTRYPPPPPPPVRASRTRSSPPSSTRTAAKEAAKPAPGQAPPHSKPRRGPRSPSQGLPRRPRLPLPRAPPRRRCGWKLAPTPAPLASSLPSSRGRSLWRSGRCRRSPRWCGGPRGRSLGPRRLESRAPAQPSPRIIVRRRRRRQRKLGVLRRKETCSNPRKIHSCKVP